MSIQENGPGPHHKDPAPNIASTARVPPQGEPRSDEPLSSAGDSSGDRTHSYPSEGTRAIIAPAAYSTLPTHLYSVPRWLLWHYRLEPGKPKPLKIPTYLNGHQRNGTLDTPEDTAQLCRFVDAYGALLVSGKHEGLAVACGEVDPGVFVQALDFDAVPADQMERFMAQLPGYVEPSPSGKGVRALGIGRRFKALGSNGSGIEAYCEKRFVTVTGHGRGPLIDLADYVEQELTPRHTARAGKHAAAESSPGDAAVVISPREWTELRSALFSMPSDGRELWVNAGHALKTLGTQGRGLWLEWSSTYTEGTFDMKDAVYRWGTFNPHTLDHKWVFAEAQRQGWVNPNSNAARAALLPPPKPLVLPAPEVSRGQLPYPPGPTGSLAWLIEQTAIRPVREYAVAAAVAIVAGVAARAYTVSGTGLNVYMLAIGRSATGKELLHEGSSLVLTALKAAGYVTAGRSIQFCDFASGPALRKHVAKHPCSLTVCGEWGRKMRRLGDTRNDAMQSLRTEMTNLYHKSGPGNRLAAVAYSNKDDSIGETAGAAYSMLAETTPGTYDEALTDEMMEDGFLSRFTSMEYEGDRPDENPNRLTTLTAEDGTIGPIIKALGDLIMHAQTLEIRGVPAECRYASNAQALRQEFNAECDKHIRASGSNEALRAPWNRADLKAQRIAAALAAADNNLDPLITALHMRWAIDLIRSDASRYLRKFKLGDIGNSDGTRMQKVQQFCIEYLHQPLTKGYEDCEHLKAESIVSYRFLEVRARRNKAFSAHVLGHAAALSNAIRSLCDSGHLELVDDVKKKSLGVRSAKLYWIRHFDE